MYTEKAVFMQLSEFLTSWWLVGAKTWPAPSPLFGGVLMLTVVGLWLICFTTPTCSIQLNSISTVLFPLVLSHGA